MRLTFLILVISFLNTGCAVQLKSASHSWDDRKPPAPRMAKWAEQAPPPPKKTTPPAPTKLPPLPTPSPSIPASAPSVAKVPKHARQWLVTPPDIPSILAPAEPDTLPVGVSIREVPVRPEDAPLSPKWNQPLKEPVIPTHASFLEIAQAYLGVPYVFGGESLLEGGFDCSGLVYQVFAHKGMRVPRMAHEQYLEGIPIDIQQLQPGDLVFFSISGTVIDHVGFYAGNQQFLHAPRTGRVVSYDRLDSEYFQKRYQGARRL